MYHAATITANKVYRKKCPTGLVWLGGNGARGCKGAKRGYFVLVHVADRPAEAAPSPAAAAQSLPSSRGGATHSASSGGTEPRSRGGPWANEGGHGGKDREVGGRAPLTSRPRLSIDVSLEGSRRSVDEDDDDSVVSAPSTPSSKPLLRQAHRRSRSFQFLDNSFEGADSGGIGGDIVNRERRSMSTVFFRESTESAGSHEGNRTRAWTGGEASGAWRSADLHDGGRGARLARPGRAGGWERTSKMRERGLQRISALWNTEKDGPLSQIPVPFDRVGRRWSRTFNVDAANTAGPLETSGATLGVAVSALTGQFHRTRVVTLYPRLIVRNFLGIPLEVRNLLWFFVCDSTTRRS